MIDQRDRAARFAELHRAGTFVVANAYDAGTARALSGLGFAALATTSGGLAFALGLRDGANLVGRDRTLANAAAIVAATDLPVTADLENGFGPRPEDVAQTVRAAAAVGLVGGSIEDATGEPDRPVHGLTEAVERVGAAVAAARALPFPFTLTARAENFLHGRPDLDDTIARLRAYAAAGADVVYAPGLPGTEAIRAVCDAVDVPVNVLAAGAALDCTVEQLGQLGARRVSLGSALPRAAMAAVLAGAREVAESGTFGFARSAISAAEVSALMRGGADG